MKTNVNALLREITVTLEDGFNFAEAHSLGREYSVEIEWATKQSNDVDRAGLTEAQDNKETQGTQKEFDKCRIRYERKTSDQTWCAETQLPQQRYQRNY